MTDLKTRIRIGASVDIQIYRGLKDLSAKTQIPVSRLLDNAIAMLIDSYEKQSD